MNVWILYDRYFDTIEGVYSEAGKEKREQQFYEEAVAKREACNAELAKEIAEFKELRKPYLDEADKLLLVEREAKEANHISEMKDARKQRKVMLKQADKLTYEITKRENKIHNSQIMLKKDLICTYVSTRYIWEEHCVLGEE